MSESVRFDHYEVLTRDDGSLWELGRGAMGITYKAYDTNLRVPVALKVINGTYLDSEIARQGFVREARSAAKLRHHNVASVFHLGMEGGNYFYAMEFIDGETIDAVIRRQGPLKPYLALIVTDQVARALNAAQPHGLVHRDIKPSNLMLVRDDDEIMVKVIDFGLARSSSGDDHDAEAEALSGFVGTPHFASPEQLEVREIDVRSDIYSVGATLWFMITGQTVFSGPVAQVMEQHRLAEPPWEKLSGVPQEVVSLLRRLLAKQAGERPQTPSDLRAAIALCMKQVSEDTPAAAAPSAVKEDFATMLGNASRVAAEGAFDVGTAIGERYRVDRIMGETNAGRMYRAYDSVWSRSVRVLALRREWVEEPNAFSQLDRDVERSTALKHSNLLAIHGLEAAENGAFLISEWTTGFSLLDLLRVRRELTPAEVLAIVRQAANGIDAALDGGLKKLDVALHSILIDFQTENFDREELLHKRIGEWPPFVLKINPLSLTRDLSQSETWAGGKTMVGGTTGKVGDGVEPRVRAIQSLAAVAYELLGGKLSPLATGGNTAPRYTPLSVLTETGNLVMHRALDPTGGFETAEKFYSAMSDPDNVELVRMDTALGSTVLRAPLPLPTVGPATVFAAEPKRPAPVGLYIGGAAGVFILGAVITYFAVSKPAKRPRLASTDPTVQTTDDPTADEPEATPKPTPRPLSLEEQLALRIKAAEELEDAESWPEAISAWLKIEKDFPDREVGRQRSEQLVDRLRARPKGMEPEVFAGLRKPLEDAAEMGVISATVALGENLRKIDQKAAVQYFQQAAAKKHPAGIRNLALMVSNGHGIERDIKKAAEMFEEAANLGDVESMTALAQMMLIGRDIPKNEKRGMELLEEAASKNNGRALDLLGTCYHKGNTVVKRDVEEAVKLFERSIDVEYVGAYANLAALYLNGETKEKNPGKGISLMLKGANKGDPRAMFMYARCLDEALGGLNRNAVQAKDWYAKAASLGEPNSIKWLKDNNQEVPPLNR